MDPQPDTAAPSGERPFLTPQEARVLAALMEKQLTTPKYYPMTPNALTQACNQKSSREPVMSLSEGEVRHILNLLEHRGLAKVDSGERTYRVSHRIRQAFDLERPELAVLTVLMLRFPQTLNDILRRTARMADFTNADDVQRALDSLMKREQPLAMLLPRAPGRREDRYWHTLCGEFKEERVSPDKELTGDAADERFAVLEERVHSLEAKVEELTRRMGELGRE